MEVIRSAPREASPARKALTGLIIFLVGVGPTIALNVYGGTRNFRPVDMAVPLRPATIHSGPFRLNHSGLYLIEYQVQRTLPDQKLNCLLGLENLDPARCREGQPRIASSWVLRSGTSVVAQGANDRWRSGGSSRDDLSAEIGEFRFTSDQRNDFTLDVTIKNNMSQLKDARPRLVVEIHPHDTKGLYFYSVLATYLAIVALPFVLWKLGGALIDAIQSRAIEKQWTRNKVE